MHIKHCQSHVLSFFPGKLLRKIAKVSMWLNLTQGGTNATGCKISNTNTMTLKILIQLIRHLKNY